MNNDLRRLRLDRQSSKPAPSLRPALPSSPLLDCYLPLVQKLFALREEQPAGVIVAFTSVARGEGVTHVVESLGRKLAEHTWEQVLLTTAADLVGAASALFEDGSDRVPQVQRLVKPRGLHSGPRTLRWDDLQGLRHRFGFVLVDCPAMRTSSEALNILSVCDGAALVVAAGEARRTEIENAQKILQASSVKLLGMILNKQVDPVPGFISRLL